jgi:hypothetical protein
MFKELAYFVVKYIVDYNESEDHPDRSNIAIYIRQVIEIWHEEAGKEEEAQGSYSREAG